MEIDKFFKCIQQTMYKDFDSITDYVKTANRDILEYQSSNDDAKGMGTTMTVVEISQDGTLSLAHVGDSRCYVLSSRNKLVHQA